MVRFQFSDDVNHFYVTHTVDLFYTWFYSWYHPEWELNYIIFPYMKLFPLMFVTTLALSHHIFICLYLLLSFKINFLYQVIDITAYLLSTWEMKSSAFQCFIHYFILGAVSCHYWCSVSLLPLYNVSFLTSSPLFSAFFHISPSHNHPLHDIIVGYIFTVFTQHKEIFKYGKKKVQSCQLKSMVLILRC